MSTNTRPIRGKVFWLIWFFWSSQQPLGGTAEKELHLLWLIKSCFSHGRFAWGAVCEIGGDKGKKELPGGPMDRPENWHAGSLALLLISSLTTLQAL